MPIFFRRRYLLTLICFAPILFCISFIPFSLPSCLFRTRIHGFLIPWNWSVVDPRCPARCVPTCRHFYYGLAARSHGNPTFHKRSEMGNPPHPGNERTLAPSGHSVPPPSCRTTIPRNSAIPPLRSDRYKNKGRTYKGTTPLFNCTRLSSYTVYQIKT